MVALVTGASRGGGKGIALVLGEGGATVYVTGRSVRGLPRTLDRPGTIDDTAEEITARGGTGIAVRLDVLVDNAWSGYELPPELAREYGFTDVDGKQQSAFWDEHWSVPWPCNKLAQGV